MKKMIPMGLAILCLIGCQDQNRKEEVRSMVPMAADSTSIYEMETNDIKLVRTAGMQCKVTDVHQATRSVSALVQSMGGMVGHQLIEAIPQGSKELPHGDDSLMVITAFQPGATLQLRVPAENLESFLYRIGDLATFVNSSRMDVDDKSLEYLVIQKKHRIRMELLEKLKVSKVKDATALINEKELAIDQEMSNRQINADVRYSLVDLQLTQNPILKKEVIANTALGVYELPFAENFKLAIRSGWNHFLDLLTLLAHAWIWILIGLVAWIFYKGHAAYRKPA